MAFKDVHPYFLRVSRTGSVPMTGAAKLVALYEFTDTIQ